jgi:hypothetical protein
MTLTAQDWRKLQLPIITLGVALIVSTLLYSATDARILKVRNDLQKQQTALRQARQHLETSGMEKDNIVKFMPAYQKLIDRGFVGEEQRVDWIDDLRKINMRYKLFGINYDIGTQEEYKPKFPLDTGSFKLHRSSMKITFAMLHENDLSTLLTALPGESNPPFMLRDCTIERVPGGGKGKFLPNLNTSCEIDWLTVTEPPGSGAKP